MSEDIIVDLIYHYYSSTSLVYSHITPACVYNHQKNETFDTFINRAERIIGAANIPTLTLDQIAILFHINMMTNRHMLEEVHKDFDRIFNMSYDQAMYRFRTFHTNLLNSKTRNYDGVGPNCTTVIKQEP